MANIILDIIYRPVFHLKHNVSETGLCAHLQMEPTYLGPRDRSSWCPEAETGSVGPN
jgi:hypothetical protein